MAKIDIIITDAGLAEIVNAEKNGTAPVVLSEIGFGTGKYTPSASQTALTSEFKRLDAVSGVGAGDNVLHVTVSDAGADTYSVYEIGVYTESGTLFAVCSQSTPIITKAASAQALLALDIALSNVNPESVAVGDTNFLLNTATTEEQGIIELATEAEAKAGMDTKRAVTPATLDKVIDNHNNIVHRSGAENINGEKRFLNTTIHKADLKFTTTVTTDLTKEADATEFWFGDRFVDSNGVQGGQFQYFRKPNGDAEINMQVKSKASNPFGILSLVQTKDGTSYATVPPPAAGDNSTKIATTAWVTQKAKEYLPLAGGKMSGGIYSSQDSARFVIGGGTNYDKGGHIVLNGKDSTNNPGGFELITHDGTKTMAFYGKTDGSLTWCGKNIVRSVNNISATATGDVSITAKNVGALPLTGGTMTGAITLDGTASVFAADRDLWLSHSSGNTAYRAAMLAGDDYNTGASLYMHGMDYEPNPGQFSLRAHNGETGAALLGKPDGTLTWGGKDISLGYPNYAAGVALGSLSSYTATADGWIYAYARREAKYWQLFINGVQVFASGGSSFDMGSCFMPVKNGDIVTVFNGCDATDTSTIYSVAMYFYPNR